MVKRKYTQSEIKKIIKKIVELLKLNNIAVDKIILYGSYASGKQREHSDIDIAVISPAFKEKKILDIQEKLAIALSKYLSTIEPVGYSSEEFEKATPETLIGQIKKSGKILYTA